MNLKDKIGKEVKHLKSGGTYRILTVNSHLESEGLKGELYVVYENIDDGLIWIREQNEFFDGRFQEITNP